MSKDNLGSSAQKKATINFQPLGKRVQVVLSKTVLEAASEVGIGIRSDCGGVGQCGKCLIIIEPISNANEPSEAEREHIQPEQLRIGYRLACLTKIKGDLTVVIIPESTIGARKIQVKGMEQTVKIDPAIRKVYIELLKPRLHDKRPDLERLMDALQEREFEELEIYPELLKVLPDILRSADWNVTSVVWNEKQIVSVERGNTEDTIYGFSVDVGTSKIVGCLVDLTSGDQISVKSMENPQLAYGDDILSRMMYATTPNRLRKLQTLLIDAINALINQACQETIVNLQNIYEMTIVGNTAMHHFVLGIQPRYLTVSPFAPAVKRPVNVRASHLGFNMNSFANIHVLPIIAGFVGADAVASLIATGLYESDDLSLLIDVGSNSEVLLGNNEDIICCSCAAGPAFEGMQIRYGMKASTGAIEGIKIDSETYEVKYVTIGGNKPVGICGSGMVDIVAEMFKSGIIDRRGKFRSSIHTERLHNTKGEIEFIIAWKKETGLDTDITINQKDIQAIQMAKGAIHAGIAMLMSERKVTEDDIDHLYIAGAFGSYLNLENAKVIGLIPDLSIDKIKIVGNTAISGAMMVLTSREMKNTAQKLSKNIRYLELMATPGFRKEYLNSIYIPHRNTEIYTSVFKKRNID